MVSGFVTSPFDHSRIWSGLASEIRIALKLLTSSMVLLHVAAWLGDVMRTVSERGRVGRAAAPRRRGLVSAGTRPRGDGVRVLIEGRVSVTVVAMPVSPRTRRG